MLVVDQVAPVDPVAAGELNAFERMRDPSHTCARADIDLRHLFESNELVLLRAEYEREERELELYLDLAGCQGEARARAEGLAPRPYVAELGWYLLEKREPRQRPEPATRRGSVRMQMTKSTIRLRWRRYQRSYASFVSVAS